MPKELRVLVTGAARGIGMATAQALAKRGHSVVATDISPLSGLEGIETHLLDVTSDESVGRCLEEVGPLDAIVNNAGIFGQGPVESYPLDRVRQVIAKAIEDPATRFRVPVGQDAEMILGLRRSLDDQAFEDAMRKAVGITW